MIVNKLEIPTIVVIIGKEGCTQCQQQKKWFSKKKIPFVYTDFKNVGVGIKREIGEFFREQGQDTDEIPYPTIIVISGEERFMFFGFHEKTYEEMFLVE